MQFPCQKRIWRMLRDKDRALLRATYHYGLSHRVVGSLMGVSHKHVGREVARLLSLLRNSKVIMAMQKAQGNDLYLLKLRYIYRLPDVQIALHSGLSGDRGGHTDKAIARRIRRILKNGDPHV